MRAHRPDMHRFYLPWHRTFSSTMRHCHIECMLTISSDISFAIARTAFEHAKHARLYRRLYYYYYIWLDESRTGTGTVTMCPTHTHTLTHRNGAASRLSPFVSNGASNRVGEHNRERASPPEVRSDFLAELHLMRCTRCHTKNKRINKLHGKWQENWYKYTEIGCGVNIRGY